MRATPWFVSSSNTNLHIIADYYLQPPVGGVGANAGFQDAADLFTALSQFETCINQSDRERPISEFEQAMLGRAKTAVERSSMGAGMFFGMRPLTELKLAALSH